jgi:ligand-binding sensor domain-containing protein
MNRRRRGLQKVRFLLGWTIICAAIAVLPPPTFVGVGSSAPARDEAGSLPDNRTDPLPAKLTVVDGQNIRFRRLPESAGLSQTRVHAVVQDNLGFIWFGTQYGLNRFDGYRAKVFKHETGNSKSVSCVYIHSLFIDHSGTLWVGCDRSLDKFDPITETFTHFLIETEVPGRFPAAVIQISEDRRTGMLYLATARGLYRLNPATGQTTRYAHDPAQRTSIAGSLSFSGTRHTPRLVGNRIALRQNPNSSQN